MQGSLLNRSPIFPYPFSTSEKMQINKNKKYPLYLDEVLLALSGSSFC